MLITHYQNFRRLVLRDQHINWAVIDQGLVSGMNFLTRVALARFLGVEEFGRFTLTWISILFANAFQSALIIAPMMSIGPKQSKDEMSSYYGGVVFQQLVLSIVFFIFLVGGFRVSHRFFPHWGIYHLAFPLATAEVTFQIQDFLRRYFFVTGRPGYALLNDAISYFGQLLGLLLLFQVVRPDSATALWIIAATSGIAIGVGVLFLKPIAWQTRRVVDVLVRHWHFSKWLTLSAAMQWITRNIFIVAAAGFLGTASVGALRACLTLTRGTHVIFEGLQNVIPVRAAQHFQRGGEIALSVYLKRVTLLLSSVTGALVLPLMLAPGFWLGHLFGPEYVKYSNTLRWYVLISLLMSLTFPLEIGIRTLEKTRIVFQARTWTTLLSAVLAVPLIYELRIHGVVLSQLCMQLILFGVFFRQYYKRSIEKNSEIHREF